jgi:hypothetical protein
VAKALTLGTSILSYGGGVSSLSLKATSVSATVQVLVSYAYSGTMVSPSSLAQTEMEVASVQVQPTLSLTAELQTAAVVTYAIDDDGVWTDVSRYPTLRLGSTSDINLDFTKSGADWQLVVLVGASSISDASPVITGRLYDSCGTPLTLAGYGYAETNLSVPVAIVITATASTLARPSTPAATVLGITTSTQLTITVTFRSVFVVLSYRDFTLDSCMLPPSPAAQVLFRRLLNCC